ncbi:MAG: hypothetical protein H7Z73_00730 [Candidatus Saccharibacteria bacterium]|nr:hypothetical protein [Moraxellaceae bacterium]
MTALMEEKIYPYAPKDGKNFLIFMWSVVGIIPLVTYCLYNNFSSLALGLLFIAWITLTGMALWFSYAMVKLKLSPNSIRLTLDSIIAPVNAFSTRLVTIPYPTIQDMRMHKVEGRSVFAIIYQQGHLKIHPSALSSRAQFDDFIENIFLRSKPYIKKNNSKSPTVVDIFKEELKTFLLATYIKHDQEVDFYTLFSALGALSGFATQAGLRQQYMVQEGLAEAQIFTTVQTTNNDTYYFAVVFDDLLFRLDPKNPSIYSILADGLKVTGHNPSIDIHHLAKISASKVGHEDYGIIAETQGYTPTEQPLETLQKHWSKISTMLINQLGQGPAIWGLFIAYVAQELLIAEKDHFSPELAAHLVMTNVISMSKIDPIKVIPH